MKNAKRNVIVSAFMAIALCMSVVAGATFALFTSNSSVNIAITSGNVQVTATASDLVVYSPTSVNETEILDRENAAKGLTFANGGTATLTGNELKLDNMTPGDKASFTITVENKSTVAVKYRTKLVCSENDGLYSGLEYEIGGYKNTAVTDWQTLGDKGEIAKFDCFVELPVKAGSEYNNKKCTLAFVVEAVQGNADKSGETVVNDNLVKGSNGTYGLTDSDRNNINTKNVTYNIPAGTYDGGFYAQHIGINSTFDCNNAIFDRFELSCQYVPDTEKSVLTVKNLNVKGDLIIQVCKNDVVIENCTAKHISVLKIDDGSSVTIKNCKVTGTPIAEVAGNNKYGVYVTAVKDAVVSVNVSDSEISGTKGHAIAVNGGNATFAFDISGNVFANYGLDGKEGRAAFKIWGDAELAPASSTTLNEKATALAKSIAANNTFGERGDNCVIAEFYGAIYNFA